MAAAASGEGRAAIVAHATPQSIGVNQEVNIDFNSDGQIDFQIDHDRVNLNGNNLDYLQIDKNDVSSAANPLPIDNFATFPLNGTNPNADMQYLAFDNELGDQGGYVVGLKAGDMIGTLGSGNGKGVLEGTRFDFQEGTNFQGGGTTIRANRLIDEDHGQIDTTLGGANVDLPFGPRPEFPNLDDFIGVNGQTRYVGVRMDLNDAIHPNSGINLNNNDAANQFVHGWIGVRIDNEADATGTITGWAYESTPGVAIAAGDVGPVQSADYDRNGLVDGGDLLLWQRQLGSSVTAGTGADGTLDGLVNAADLALWKGAFGTPASSALAAVPEPSTLAAALMMAACCVAALWRRARKLALN